MRIAIGADHGGYRLKEVIKKSLIKSGYRINDFGTDSESSCDYPLIGYEVAKAVSNARFKKAILICKSGIGMSIVANKVKNVRAALCHTVSLARSSRQHNDANILILAANLVREKLAKKMVKVWLSTEALGGRHRRRVRQIAEIERNECT